MPKTIVINGEIFSIESDYAQYILLLWAQELEDMIERTLGGC